MSILHHLLLTLFCVCIISDSVHSSHEINPLPPCELVFPKQGDELIHSGHTYSLLMCHFSPAAELLLNETLRQYSVVVRALAIEPHSMQYKKAFEFPPVTSYSPVMDDVKLTTISEFFLPSAPFQLDIRYKLVYEVYIGDTIMDQVTTVVTYKDSDYFRAQLGLQKINLVDVEKLCENENESDTCSLLDSVCDSLFTQRFDFIEVGTSAFDTCLQKAESHHRGISVEPVSYYQDMLPSPPGVIKENAAIDAKQMDSEVDFGLMYYLDPNDLLAHGIAMDGPYYYMYGISSFGSIQANLLNSYRLEAKYDATPSIFLQRSRLVPRLSMEELYTKHAVREVGVVKLDCEGLDIAIMASYLDMLQKFHLPFPCVISYEVLASNKEFYSLVETLQSVGYAIISLTYDAAPAGDFVAVHAQCPSQSQRRQELSLFLPDDLDQVEDLCNRSGKQQGYCCVTKSKTDGNSICNQFQSFMI